MKITVIFLLLYDTLLGGKTVSADAGHLYKSVHGKDLTDDVTRDRRDVRSKLECALACVQTGYCGMFAVCRREPGTQFCAI